MYTEVLMAIETKDTQVEKWTVHVRGHSLGIFNNNGVQVGYIAIPAQFEYYQVLSIKFQSDIGAINGVLNEFSHKLNRHHLQTEVMITSTARAFWAQTTSPVRSRVYLHMSKFTTTAATSSASNGHTRPNVGVGVLLLRHLLEKNNPEVLLIRRGKPPSKGMWSFCGGTLELGEALVDCAIREAREETGLKLRHLKNIVPGTSVFYKDLQHPAVFSAVDVIDREPPELGTINQNLGAIRFHYAVVEVAAVPENYREVPVAGDDADEVQWVDVEVMKDMDELVVNAVAVVEEALARFEIPRE